VTGTAIGLVTYKGTTDPCSNFVGIAATTGPTWSASNCTISPLHNSTNRVAVSVAGQTVTVDLNGLQVLQQVVPTLAPRAVLEFTGGAGGLTDLHEVSNVSISNGTTLEASPSTVNLPATSVGSSSQTQMTLTNPGDSGVVVEGAPIVVGPFSVSGLPSPSTEFASGASATTTVTFTPSLSTLGPLTGSITLPTDDGSLVIPLTATNSTVSIGDPTRGGWHLAGSATLTSSGLQLTPALANQAGSAFWPTSLAAHSISASFTASLSGGTGADGLTFAVIPAGDGAGSVGYHGGSLGWASLGGVAVGLDTFKDTGYVSNNFVGIATGFSPAGLTWASTSTNISALRTGTHLISVTITGIGGATQTITVSVDGIQVLDQTAAFNVPTNALVGFTGGTGGLTDVHTVSNVSITAS